MISPLAKPLVLCFQILLLMLSPPAGLGFAVGAKWGKSSRSTRSGITRRSPLIRLRRRYHALEQTLASTTTTSSPITKDHDDNDSKKKKSAMTCFLDNLFQKDCYDRNEAVFVVIAAAIVGLNTGFINGVTVSATFLQGTNSIAKNNPATQMVAGTAGSFTANALAFARSRTKSSAYFFTLGMILSYIGGACLAGFINKGAEKQVIEPRYGPTFFVVGVFLSVASLLANLGMPSRYIYFLTTASLGIQNAIASLYSANLSRCTMTGVTTDTGAFLGQCIGGDYRNLSRGMVVGGVLACFWIGGLLASPSVAKWKQNTLVINAAVFFLLSILCTLYLKAQLGLTHWQASTGRWRWKEVLKHLDPNRVNNTSPDTTGTTTALLTREDFHAIFDEPTGVRVANDNSNDKDELLVKRRQKNFTEAQLRTRLEQDKTIQMSALHTKILFRAADRDKDGSISFDEWEEIIDNLLWCEQKN